MGWNIFAKKEKELPKTKESRLVPVPRGAQFYLRGVSIKQVFDVTMKDGEIYVSAFAHDDTERHAAMSLQGAVAKHDRFAFTMDAMQMSFPIGDIKAEHQPEHGSVVISFPMVGFPNADTNFARAFAFNRVVVPQ